MNELTDDVLQTIRSAAKLLTGYKRRQFQAQIALPYCNGSARRAETTFGWGRAAVETGLNERRTGIRCRDAYELRGRKKSEQRCPELEEHIHRLVEPQAEIELVYLPPYHSKYNPIERCWGILESHWNGALLSSVARALCWAGTMTWRAIHPLVREITTTYQRGLRLTKAAFRPFAERLIRSATLPKWSLCIRPYDR